MVQLPILTFKIIFLQISDNKLVFFFNRVSYFEFYEQKNRNKESNQPIISIKISFWYKKYIL